MTTIDNYNITGSAAAGAVAIVFYGTEVATITNAHPNYDAVLHELSNNTLDTIDSEHVIGLIEETITGAIYQQMQQLSDHITYDGQTIFYDDQPLHSSVSEHMIQRLLDGTKDWEPLALFLERMANNPSMVARNELYDWLMAEGLTIAPDGRFIGYKGIGNDSLSVSSGYAFVNGERVDGRIPNYPGNVISMNRADVNDNRNEGCSYGLHVGSTDYAQSFGGRLMATVLVDPADVVSIPNDDYRKLRCAKYEVFRVETKTSYHNFGRNNIVDEDEFYDEDDADWDDEPCCENDDCDIAECDADHDPFRDMTNPNY